MPGDNAVSTAPTTAISINERKSALPDRGTQKEPADTPTSGTPFRWHRLWPLAVLLAGLVLFFVSGAGDYLTLDALREHRATLLDWVEHYAVLTALAYLVIYAVITALSLPIATLITVLG